MEEGGTSEPAPPADRAESPTPEPRARPPEVRPEEDWATRYRYLLADFDNFRKRSERERELGARRAQAELLRELIPLYEAFGHARRSIPDEAAELARGFDLLEAEWQKFFQRESVRPVATVGAPFVPEDEEAVGETAAGEGRPEGTVVEIVQQGYRCSGGLLRPAKVVVARRSEPPALPAPPSEQTDP